MRTTHRQPRGTIGGTLAAGNPAPGMHIHILGICGTFMGSLALLAREAGHHVTGCDINVYPPMSDLLAAQGVGIIQGYDPAQLDPEPDCVIIGNAMSRGNPLVEAVLDRGLTYSSGPQWLADHILRQRWVLAVSGTHGKTTTAGMLAWLLESAGLQPGFLIGGVPGNFPVSARLGGSPFFVIEADEYDSAFFDKRSKFVHFRPRTLIINNMEHDHADIFPDLAAIQRQFHHLIRTVPGSGLIIANGDQKSVADTLAMGCWSELCRIGTGTDNHYQLIENPAGFSVRGADLPASELNVPMPGAHNASNALSALLAARHVGVRLQDGLQALAGFKGMRRRQELRGEAGGVRIYDDFAHHPTAIEATIQAMRPVAGGGRLIAVLELRSNTMRLGIHRARLPASLRGADQVWLYQDSSLDWAVSEICDALQGKADWRDDLDTLVRAIAAATRPGDCVLVMSNGGFGGIHQRLLDTLAQGRQAGEQVQQ